MIPYLFTPGKAPSERRSFAFDFVNAPEFHRHGSVPAQTIVDYTVICDDQNVSIETPILTGTAYNPTIVSAYINGGLAGNTYSIIFSITTNTGTVIQRSVLLPVNNL